MMRHYSALTSAMFLPFTSPQALIMAECRSRNPNSLPRVTIPVCLTIVPSIIHAGMYSCGSICGAPCLWVSSGVGANAGAAHRPKGVVLLDQAWVQHMITWAATPKVILQRCTACRHLGLQVYSSNRVTKSLRLPHQKPSSRGTLPAGLRVLEFGVYPECM